MSLDDDSSISSGSELSLDGPGPTATRGPASVAASESELKARVAAKPNDIEARTELANIYLKRHRVSDVISLLRPMSDQLARQGLLILAEAFAQSGNSIDEIRTLDMINLSGNSDYYTLFRLGQAYVRKANQISTDPATRLTDREQAMNKFYDSIQTNKKFLPAYEALLQQYELTENRHEARSLLADMLKNFGDRPVYYDRLCQLYSEDSYLEKAIELCKKSISLTPNLPNSYIYLGRSLREANREKEGEQIIYSSALRFPASALAQENAGRLAFELKNFGASYKYYKLGAQQEPTNIKILTGLAYSAIEEKHYPEALKALSQACAYDRNVSSELRKAAALARQRREPSWSIRFDNAIVVCGTQQRR